MALQHACGNNSDEADRAVRADEMQRGLSAYGYQLTAWFSVAARGFAR